MGLETRLPLKQTQELVMTAVLQQAIKLSPMARLELVQTVQQELLDSPLLEEVSLAAAWLAPKGPGMGAHQPGRAPPAPAAAGAGGRVGEGRAAPRQQVPPRAASTSPANRRRGTSRVRI